MSSARIPRLAQAAWPPLPGPILVNSYGGFQWAIRGEKGRGRCVVHVGAANCPRRKVGWYNTKLVPVRLPGPGMGPEPFWMEDRVKSLGKAL